MGIGKHGMCYTGYILLKASEAMLLRRFNAFT